ncbi:MAG TPA: hypothetical protein PLM44_03095 [bacterium]|jgi:antitoxin component of RelBE/YafQ-DinJ toxin-antitoxin module|nr:hypothetical protein [bacterium]
MMPKGWRKEGRKGKAVSVRIEDAVKDKLVERCKRDGVTITQKVNELIKLYIERK